MFSRFIKKWASDIPLKVKLLLGLVIILGLLILGVQYKPNSNQMNSLLLPDLNEDPISRIELSHSEQNQTLMKNDDGSWSLSKGEEEVVPADPEKISQLLKAIAEIKKDLIVSNNEEKQNLFLVDSTGLEVKLYSGENMRADFFAGKPGPNWSSQYFRLADSNEIIQYNQNLIFGFEQDFAFPESTPKTETPEESQP